MLIEKGQALINLSSSQSGGLIMADMRLPAHLYANQRSPSREESVPSLKSLWHHCYSITVVTYVNSKSITNALYPSMGWTWKTSLCWINGNFISCRKRQLRLVMGTDVNGTLGKNVGGMIY